MMKLPKVLQDNNLGFCRIKRGTKKPFEKDWTNKVYGWKEIQKFDNENYGVLCGVGYLAVIDADTGMLQTHIEKVLPKTFRVRTGGGGMHNYFFIKGLTKKIILWDKETHLGEVQSWGTQVVAPGSLHESGTTYEVAENHPIIELGLDDLIEAIKPYMREFVTTLESAAWEQKETTDLAALNVSDVWGTTGLSYRNGEYYGSHPVHGSEGGMNFWMNTSKNLWHCFRCNSGGSALSAVAVKEGIIDCSDALPGRLRGSSATKAIQVAKERYGVKNTLTSQQKRHYGQYIEPPEIESPKDYEIITDAQLEVYEEEERPWIIDGLIPAKSVGVWTGKRSTFKTFIVLDAIFCITSGTPFIGRETTKGGVLYLDKENGRPLMKQRTIMLKKGANREKTDDIAFIFYSMLKLDRLTDIAKLKEDIKEYKPKLIVVDTYRRGISFEENDAGEVSKLFVDILRPLVEECDCSLLLIHHDRKGESQGDEMDMIRGSSDLANYVDFIIKNERRGDTIVIKQLKNRNAPELPPQKVVVRATEESIQFIHEGEFNVETAEDKATQVISDWLISHGVKSFTTAQARDVAFSRGVKSTNFKRALVMLESNELIHKQLRGMYEVNRSKMGVGG